MKRSRLAMLFLLIFFILPFPILLMRPPVANPAILHVSIPAGENRTGISDPDKWLSECWLLNVTGASGVFTVKIEDVSKSISSHDTHLVIAFNDIAYNNLVSLTVDTITMVKSDFKYGALRPYNLRNWPYGDVYPTWFNDTLVNMGTIPPKGHMNVTVSVTFSNATGARMHFDAYGSKKSSPIPPTKKRYITHNPLSEDSTVLFSPSPLIPPVACFTVSNDCPNVCETVTFNATCSYDPGGWIVNYAWNFGDSNITAVTDPIITHHYDTFGNYTATLTVADNDGSNNSTSKPIWVRGHPVARFTYFPSYPQVCEVVVFNASDSTPDGGCIVSYTWNFGDSNITTVADPVITHHYDNYGNYTVTLNVTDSEGKWDTESKVITVRAHPHADFTWSPSSPQANEEVTFNASASTPDGGEIVSYKWDFGDGGKGDGEILTHTYATFGNFTVTLNVTDSEGKWDTESKNITVQGHPQADFTWLPLSPQVNEDVTFDASSSAPNGGTIVCYNWDFGDGYTDSGKIVVHQFSNWGTFAVKLNVTDSEGKWDVVSKNITVRAHPHADFTWSPTSPQVGELTTFDGSPSTPDGGTIVSYEWDFGDTSPHEFGKIVAHTYKTYGTYTVTLNVTDSEGKWNIVTKTITVRAHPNADFTWSPLQPEEDQTVTFDASASTPDGGTIISYKWNFGDGNFGSGKIVTYVYTTAGTYTVTLTVTDSEDKSDTESKQITITSPPPVGGHIAPIRIAEESPLQPSPISLISILLASIAILTILIRSKSRRALKIPKTP